jgi:outer membrane lipoprotein SlyB
MNTTIKFFTALLALFAISFMAVADDMFVYPAKGQSNEQMEKDKFSCYGWAKQNTGFDPMAQPRATSAPPQQGAQKGGAGRGAVRGGLGGAAIGALAGDTRKGAAIGAVGGGLIGGVRRNDQVKQEQHSRQQWEQQESANYSHNRNNYNRAYAACLDGRGYTVK